MAEKKKAAEVAGEQPKMGLVDAGKAINTRIKVDGIKFVIDKDKKGKSRTLIFSAPADGSKGKLLLYVGAQKIREGETDCRGTYNCSPLLGICSEVGEKAPMETVTV